MSYLAIIIHLYNYSYKRDHDKQFSALFIDIDPNNENLYKGDKIPEGKKSISFRFKLGNDETTLTKEEINDAMNSILKVLNKKYGATLREE